MEILTKTTSLFKQKTYRYFFIWQLISYVGGWMQGTALNWLVYRLTHSSLILGAVVCASLVPSLLFSPISGILTDRFKRKNVLIATQCLFLVHGTLLIILFFTNSINEWYILGLSIFFGIINSFDIPTREALIPLLVKEEDSLNAISTSSILGNAANILGPLIGGILITKYGEGICFILNVVLHVPFIIFLILVGTRKQVIKEFTSPLIHMKEGFIFSWRNKPIKALLIFLGMFSFFGLSFIAFLPIFSDEILHTGAKGLGLLTGASGLGAIVGGFYLATRPVVSIKRLVAYCGMIFSMCLLCFSISKSFIVSILLLLILGFTFMIVEVGTNTLLQAMSPDYIRGRVIGLFITMIMGMFSLGTLVMGALGKYFPIQTVTATGAFICLVSAIYFTIKVPSLIKELVALIDKKEAGT